MTAKPRLVVADDHRLVAAGLERLLADDCTVVNTVYDSDALLQEVRRSDLDLIVQDIWLQPLNGVDLIREVRHIDPSIGIIVIATCDDAKVAANAFRAGASSYVLKSGTSEELLEAVACAMEQKSYVTPLLASKLVQSLGTDPPAQSGSQLTERQRDILRLLAEGKSMKQVAATLDVTVRTVAFHKYQMMRLLDIKSSAELVRYAVLEKIA